MIFITLNNIINKYKTKIKNKLLTISEKDTIKKELDKAKYWNKTIVSARNFSKKDKSIFLSL